MHVNVMIVVIEIFCLPLPRGRKWATLVFSKGPGKDERPGSGQKFRKFDIRRIFVESALFVDGRHQQNS